MQVTASRQSSCTGPAPSWRERCKLRSYPGSLHTPLSLSWRRWRLPDDGTPRSTIPAIVSATEIAPNNSSLGRSQSMAKQLSKMPDLATQIARSTLLRESPVQVSRASYPFRTLLRLIGSTLYSSGTLNSPVREMTSSPIPI